MDEETAAGFQIFFCTVKACCDLILRPCALVGQDSKKIRGLDSTGKYQKSVCLSEWNVTQRSGRNLCYKAMKYMKSAAENGIADAQSPSQLSSTCAAFVLPKQA